MFGRLGRASRGSSLKSFPRSNGTLEYSGISDVLPRHPDSLQRHPKQCRLLKSNSLLNTDWPIVQTVLLWCLDVFNVYLYDTAGRPDAFKGTSGRLHRSRLFCLGFCKDFSWTFCRSLWSVIVFDLSTVWIHENSELKIDYPVKTQPLHKVFLFYPECSQ
jgi:hypothetical protein